MAIHPLLRKRILFLRIVRRLSYRQVARTINHSDHTKIGKTTVKRTCDKHKNNVHADVQAESTTQDRPHRRRVNGNDLQYLDDKIRENPERSSVDLQKLLIAEKGLNISASYIRRLRRRKLGWIAKRTKFGQMVRDVNKEKRCNWAKEQLGTGELFGDVIFTDEASFEVQRSANTTFYKKGEVVVPRPKPKHPIKVNKCCYILLHIPACRSRLIIDNV
jgi:type II secretory pathway predicted ATPase ExeA